MRKILLAALFIPFVSFAQAPAGYYSGTEGLSGYALKTKLHDIISQNYINWHYGDLQAFFNQTDLDIYYDHGPSNTTILLDIYSEIPDGPDAYEYTAANMIGSASAEGQGWNREHMMPQSTYSSNYPMYSDLFYVIPTDARINQLRSNYPYGIAGTPNYYTFTNSSQISKNGTPNSPYTGRVYEPIDEFKGDVARALLYFAVRYQGKLGTFKYNNGTSPANDTNPLDGTEEKAYDQWYIDMLLQWHAQDPVSQKEIDRNNSVFALQKNRNPFIDHPEWVTLIWSETADGIAPQAPVGLVADKVSAYFATLSWSPSPEADVLGYKIYVNGTEVATSKTPKISIDHLQPETTYDITVAAYDTGYLLSPPSLPLSVTTIATDIYAPDLMITKYLEGTGENKALEITNRTGHTVDLNNYRLSIQLPSGANYYFPAPYELEGKVEHNETFVVLNPYSNFSCVDNSQARFVTAAPQLTFNGSQYIELRYKNSTVDAIGTRNTNNFDVLGNVSLYRLPEVMTPSNVFVGSEWETHPGNYCNGLGSLAVQGAEPVKNNFTVYPNPVGDYLYVAGKNASTVQDAAIFDISGQQLKSFKSPFRNKSYIDVSTLKTGIYILKVDNQTIKFTKK